jgi:Arc/MetJ-type ribon-helix-helix transcriptional regulator
MDLTEKVTVNLSVVDLGKIDVLVAQGFYGNRTDFLKDAVRRNLNTHEGEVTKAIDRLALEFEVGVRRHRTAVSIAFGVLALSRQDLEARRRLGEKLNVVCVGALIMAEDVEPDLVEATIGSVMVFGIVKASPLVRDLLRNKMVSAGARRQRRRSSDPSLRE